jgi:hypothetical protein
MKNDFDTTLALRAYTAPQLTVFGDVTHLTAAGTGSPAEGNCFTRVC